MPRKFTNLIVLLIFLALVLVPLIYYGIDSEVAKWKAARALLQFNNGETKAAITTMQTALEQSPRDHWLKLSMTEFLIKDGQEDRALKLINEVLEHDPGSTEALRLKSNCLMYLGRPDEALQVLKDQYDHAAGTVDSMMRLNGLAYFRALAGKEIETAKADIDEVVNRVSTYSWHDRPAMSLEDQTLLAGAMISRRLGQQQKVIGLLSKRIEFYESSIALLTGKSFGSVFEKILRALAVPPDLERQAKLDERVIAAEKSFLASLYVARALIHQDMGNDSERDADRVSIEELGLEEEELIGSMLDDWDSLMLLNDGAQLLDTRAMVYAALNREIWKARHDFDVAVLASELILDSFDGQTQNTIRNENGRAFSIDDIKRTLAVILKHRSDLNLKAGRNADADRDLKKISELGFEDPSRLF